MYDINYELFIEEYLRFFFCERESFLIFSLDIFFIFFVNTIF